MAAILHNHVVGDLTIGKPELKEFCESETLEMAIRALNESSECGIPVWKASPQASGIENYEMRQQRFVGILYSIDIVAFLASPDSMADQSGAMNTPVSAVVCPNNSLLKHVDPATRIIDALELMKQGVRRLLVPKSGVWRGLTKRFSVLYNGKWLNNPSNSSLLAHNYGIVSSSSSSSSSCLSSSTRDEFCCLSREDVIRFVIGCLGALAPLPLSPIGYLGAINRNITVIDSSDPAIEATRKLPEDPSAVAVVEVTPDGVEKIIGEISSSRLWKRDYISAAVALAKLSAGQFVTGVEDMATAGSLPNLSPDSSPIDNSLPETSRPRKFSSRNIGFKPGTSRSRNGWGPEKGQSAPLTCRPSSSLAAVMAQMLSHRATHVWVTEDDSDGVLLGVVGYGDILKAISAKPSACSEANRLSDRLPGEIPS